jgi:hypothetical protein
MKATELFVKKGDEFKASGVYFCGVCRLTARTEQYAEKCCCPKICEDCGIELPANDYHYTVCPDCRDHREAARERVRFENAQKVMLADYADTMVSTVDGELISLEQLRDDQWDSRCDYVYGVRRDAIKLNNVDDESLYSDHLDDGFELADMAGIPELLTELNRLIDEWNATPNDSYQMDDSVVIELGPDFWDEDENDSAVLGDVIERMSNVTKCKTDNATEGK